MEFIGKGYFEYAPRAFLKVSGADALTFLQGQFTNDLRGLEPGGPAVYGLWLDQKGKVLADSFICAGPNAGEFLVVSYFSESGVIRQRLESYVIADDVIVAEIGSDWGAISIMAPNFPALRQRLPASCLVFAGRRARSDAWDIFFPAGENATVLATLRAANLSPLTAKAVESLRVAAAIPAVPQDIGPRDLPNEGGLETEAVSYTKGCYLGQEVMARLKSMGQIRRRLLTVTVNDGGAPVLPATLFLGGKAVGELRSVAEKPEGGFAGLALVSLLHAGPGASLSFAAGGPPHVRVDGARAAPETDAPPGKSV